MAGRPITTERERIAAHEISALERHREAGGDVSQLEGMPIPAGRFAVGEVRNTPGRFDSHQLLTLTLDGASPGDMGSDTFEATKAHLIKLMEDAIKERFRAEGKSVRAEKIEVTLEPAGEALALSRKTELTFKISGPERLHSDDHYYLQKAALAAKEWLEQAGEQFAFAADPAAPELRAAAEEMLKQEAFDADPGLNLETWIPHPREVAAKMIERLATRGEISPQADDLDLSFPGDRALKEAQDDTTAMPLYATSSYLEGPMTAAEEDEFLKLAREKLERHLDKGKFSEADLELKVITGEDGDRRLEVRVHHGSIRVSHGAVEELVVGFSDQEFLKHAREKLERHLQSAATPEEDSGKPGKGLELEIVTGKDGVRQLKAYNNDTELAGDALKELGQEFSRGEAFKRAARNLSGNRKFDPEGYLIAGGSGERLPPLLDRARIEPARIIKGSAGKKVGVISGKQLILQVFDDRSAEEIRDAVSSIVRKVEGLPDDAEVTRLKMRRTQVKGKGDHFTQIYIPLKSAGHASNVMAELERHGAALTDETRNAVFEATMNQRAPLPYSLGVDDIFHGYQGLTQLVEKRTRNNHGGEDVLYLPRPDRKVVVDEVRNSRGNAYLHFQLNAITGEDFNDYGGPGFLAMQADIERTMTELGSLTGINYGLTAKGYRGGKIERHPGTGGLMQTFGDITVYYPAPGTDDKLRISMRVDKDRLVPQTAERRGAKAEPLPSVPQMIEKLIDEDYRRHRLITQKPVRSTKHAEAQGVLEKAGVYLYKGGVLLEKGAIKTSELWDRGEARYVPKLGQYGAALAAGAVMAGLPIAVTAAAEAAVKGTGKLGEKLATEAGGVQSQAMVELGQGLQRYAQIGHAIGDIYGMVPLALYSGAAAIGYTAYAHRSQGREGVKGVMKTALQTAAAASLVMPLPGDDDIPDPQTLVIKKSLRYALPVGALLLNAWRAPADNWRQDAANAKSREDKVVDRTAHGYRTEAEATAQRRKKLGDARTWTALSAPVTQMAALLGAKEAATIIASGNYNGKLLFGLLGTGAVARLLDNKARKERAGARSTDEAVADARSDPGSYQEFVVPNDFRQGNVRVYYTPGEVEVHGKTPWKEGPDAPNR